MSNLSAARGESLESVLQIPHVVFDEIRFKRIGFKKDDVKLDEDPKIGFQSSIAKIKDGAYRVSLRIKALKPKEYEVHIQVTGFCEIDESDPNKEILLKQNAIAILFPYIRAELTLITAQPETDSIVLPVFNINALVNNADNLSNDEEENPED